MRKYRFYRKARPKTPIKIPVKKLLKSLIFMFILAGLSIRAEDQHCKALSELGSNEDLVLLQTQVTALKLASLIDIYQNPRNNAEREKAIEALVALKSPLDNNHPLIKAFDNGPYTQLLSETYTASLDMYVEGHLSINYETLPQLLMAIEFSNGNQLFDKRDFAISQMWSDKRIFDGPINPMLAQLTRIYHELNKEERERLYSKIQPELQESWNQVKEKLNTPECANLISPHQFECENGALEILGTFEDDFNKFSFDVLNVINFNLIDELSAHLKDEVDWVLHPPPENFDFSIPGFNLTRNFNGREYTEYRNQKKKYDDLYNSEDNLGLIQSHHFLKELGPYLILDKRKDRLFLYDDQTQLLGSMEAGLGPLRGDLRGDDQSENKNENLGAGIYSLSKVEDSFMEFSDQRSRVNFIETTQNGVSCTEESCSQLVASLQVLLERHNLTMPLPLYILPLNEDFEFVVKNNQLSFTTFERGLPYFEYNFTPRREEAYPTKFTISDPNYDTPFAREFLKALEDEKEGLMKLYNLDNDEYNDLVILAFGILGQESQFSEHWRYHVKETFPGGVAYLKNYRGIFSDFGKNREKEGFWSAVGTFIGDAWENEWDYFTGKISTEKNSRGPTQIKNIPDLIEEKYGVTKESLSQPRDAAVATLGFLAQSLPELKAKEKFHPDINGKNRMDYLHYIYMGNSHEITRGTATPDMNIYFRNVKKYSESLRIWQDTSP